SIWAPAVRTGLSAARGSWNTIAMRRPRTRANASGPDASRSSPESTTRPETSALPGKRPSSESATVVLPLPDSPIRPSASPRSRSNETPPTGTTNASRDRIRTVRSRTRSTPACLPVRGWVSKSRDYAESNRMQGQTLTSELARPPRAIEVPQLVGSRYRVLAPRGSGAESSVFLAVDLFTGQEVALKCGPAARLAAEYRRSAAPRHPHLAR